MKLRFNLALGMLIALLLAGAGTAGALLSASAISSKDDSRIAPTALANRSEALATRGELDLSFGHRPPLFGPETSPVMAESGPGLGARDGAAHLDVRGPRHLVRRIAEALGMTVEELLAQVRAGSTLAQIIADKGSNPDAVFNTLTADGKNKLAAEVSAGNITQAQADLRLGILKGRYTQFINSHYPARVIRDQIRQHHQGQRHGAAVRRGAVILGVSKSLNVNVPDLLAELRADKALAQVIQGHGGKVDDVLDFLSAGEKAKLSTEVVQGLITQKQMDRRLADRRARSLALLQRRWPEVIGQ